MRGEAMGERGALVVWEELEELEGVA